MPKLRVRNGWRQLRVALAVLTVAAVAALAVWPSAAALDCEGVALDDGCLFTITGGDTPEPEDGYAVTNADGVPLWDFVRERDLQALGYPISQRWVNGPFTFQAFQKVILQWDPGKSRMNYYNTLDVLANRYPEIELPNVPPHLVLTADQGADFATIKRNHLLLLDQNPTIKERFLSEPDWLNLYGLPIRYEEREAGDHPRGLQMLRAQRTVFVIWNVPAPGTTVGRVNLQNVPDKVKRLSNVIIPDAAKAPVAEDAVASLPAFTLSTPTPLPPPTSDREVLVRVYHATDGPNWSNSANWLSAAPLREWHGVSTNAAGQVTELHLHENRLRGPIPQDLGHLLQLRTLHFGDNQLSGPIPPELGRLANLRWVGLYGNRLRGPIPPAMGGLADLRWLYLYDNQLQGPIPPELGHLYLLRDLNLRSNLLDGGIPAELGNLANLRSLYLYDNQLSGEIPWTLGRLITLEQLTLGQNQFSGPIPSELSHLSNLVRLDLGENQLRGPIPRALGRLANLKVLHLDHNQLSGEIPSPLASLANLTDLRLGHNQFRGEISPAWGQLTNLKHLDVGGNEFHGTIPPELGRLANLTWLNLGGSQLSGAIPPELGNLINLGTLHLSGNQLSGTLPLELGRLTNLTWLGLEANQLSGEIPSELGDLSSLTALWLTGNQLSGPIPAELGRLDNLGELGLAHNQLRGTIPPELGRLTKLKTLRLGGGNRLTGCIPEGLRGVDDSDLATLELSFCITS